MIIYYTDGFPGGRTESHRLLGSAIAEYTGDAERAKELAGELKTMASGKPYIEGFRHFSISHTGSIWAVLIDERECGLDIQLAKSCDIAAIARRVYDRADAAEIESLMRDSRSAAAEDRFFQLWTRREALAKALGASVFDEDLPAVGAGDDGGQMSVKIGDRVFMLSDTRLPGMPELFASVCVESCDVKEMAPEYICLSGKE